MVLGWLLLGWPLVLVSVRDEQLLEIRGIGCVVFLCSANRFGRRDARGLVVFLLHMDSVGRGLGLELTHQAGRYQMHSVLHLINHFVRAHFLADILAWKSYGCTIILLLLLRVGLLQQRLVTWIMTQAINDWCHEFMIRYLLFHIAGCACTLSAPQQIVLATTIDAARSCWYH